MVRTHIKTFGAMAAGVLMLLSFPVWGDSGTIAEEKVYAGMHSTFTSYMAKNNLPDATGALNRNQGKFKEIANQRHLIDTIAYGIIKQDRQFVEYGIQAAEYAFTHQYEDGTFQAYPGEIGKRNPIVKGTLLTVSTDQIRMIKVDGTTVLDKEGVLIDDFESGSMDNWWKSGTDNQKMVINSSGSPDGSKSFAEMTYTEYQYKHTKLNAPLLVEKGCNAVSLWIKTDSPLDYQMRIHLREVDGGERWTAQIRDMVDSEWKQIVVPLSTFVRDGGKTSNNKLDAESLAEINIGPFYAESSTASAFFMGQLGRSFLMLKDSEWFMKSTETADLRARLEKMNPMIDCALTSMIKQKEQLLINDTKATNRLFFGSMAYYLLGRYAGRSDAIQVGEEIMRKAMGQQDPTGFYIENGGFDSSYQAVNLYNLEILYLNIDPANKKLKDDVAASIEKGMAWYLERILPNGEVTVDGNSRVSATGEAYNNKVKTVNYDEAVFALSYYAQTKGDKTVNDVANTVIGFCEKFKIFNQKVWGQ